MMRVVCSSGSNSRRRCSSGRAASGVEEDLVARLLRLVEVDGLDLEQREVALAFLGGRICPATTSPVRRLKRRIWLGET